MNDDIMALYDQLMRHIQDVEENNDDTDALQCVTEVFLKIFEYIKIFLISKKERYYGYFLMDMKLEIDYFVTFPAGVNMDTFPFAFRVNPLLLGRYPIKEMIYIICHEIEHIVLDHPSEGARINTGHDPVMQVNLNIAMDASVNDRLNMEIKKNGLKIMSQPEDAVTSESLENDYKRKFLRLKDFLYYFNQLSTSSAKGFAYFSGRNTPVLLPPKKDHIVTAKNRGKGNVIPIWTEGDVPEEVRASLREFAKEVCDSIPPEIRGLFPSHQQEAIRKLLEPPCIPWERILRKYVGTIPCGVRKTRTRLDRRQPQRFDLSGKMPDRTIRLVVAIDTSGSMNDTVLAKVFTEIFSILSHFKHDLTIIECDAEIQKVYKAKSMGDINLNVEGLGGTLFTPVIEYVNSQNDLRDSLLLYFTDGFGEREIPRPKVYRLLWVVTGDKRALSVNRPYGRILSMKIPEQMELLED